MAELLEKTSCQAQDLKCPTQTFYVGHKDRHCRNSTFFFEFLFKGSTCFIFSNAGKSILSMLLPCLCIFPFSLQYFQRFPLLSLIWDEVKYVKSWKLPQENKLNFSTSFRYSLQSRQQICQPGELHSPPG